MKPLSVPVLLLIGVLAAGLGAVMNDAMASRGMTLPVTGWLTALVLLVLAGVLLAQGLPLRRWMLENEERREHPTMAPRRHQVDLPTAYRTVLLARASAYTGTIVGGFFTGDALYLVLTGTGDLVTAVLPTAAAAVAGIVLAVLGVLVESWGKLPPEDPQGAQAGL